MEEILHQLTGSLSDYVQGFKYTWWWRISSILLENLDTFEVGPPKIVATGVPKDIGTAGAAAMALKKDSLGVLPLKNHYTLGMTSSIRIYHHIGQNGSDFLWSGWWFAKEKFRLWNPKNHPGAKFKIQRHKVIFIDEAAFIWHLLQFVSFDFCWRTLGLQKRLQNP